MDWFVIFKLFLSSISSNKTNKSPCLILSLLLATIFLTTPSNGEVTKLGFFAITSTGAVLVIRIGKIKIIKIAA